MPKDLLIVQNNKNTFEPASKGASDYVSDDVAEDTAEDLAEAAA